MYERPTCPACHLPIYPGQATIRMSFGTMAKSKKSGRFVSQPYSTDEIHLECGPDWVASSFSGELYDSIMDRLRGELRKEIDAESREEIKAQVWDEVVDEIGRTCAVCQTEIDMLGEYVDEDDEGPSSENYPSYQSPPHYMEAPIAPLPAPSAVPAAPVAPLPLPHFKTK